MVAPSRENDEVQRFYKYYLGQAEGNASPDIYHSFRGQKGAGLGSFLASIFRRVFPYIKSGAKAVGEELYKSGVGVLRDNLEGKSMKASLKQRVHQAGTNLTDRAARKVEAMMGNGLSTRRRRRKAQSTRSSGKRRVNAKRRRKRPVKKRKTTVRRKRTKVSTLKRVVKAKKRHVKRKRGRKNKDIFC